MLLGEILIELGKATAEQVSAALDKQREAASPDRLGEILIRDGVVSEEDVLEALGRQYGTEFMRTVPDTMLDPSLVSELPVEWARSRRLLPVRVGDRIGVLTCDPSHVSDQDDLSLLVGEEISPVLTTEREIRRSIERCYFEQSGSAEDFLADLGTAESERPRAASEANDLLRVAGAAPVSQLVNLILLEAVKARASDVHVEPFEDRIKVRYRVDGLLYEQASPPKHLESALISRLKVMGRLDIAEKRLPQDGMARVTVGEREIDIRISTIPVGAGERVVLRLLNQDSTLLPLSELGMPSNILARFRELLREPNGAIWVTGPTGSGKTTTLYAALGELDTEHMNILTIEDPVEYHLSNIGQISVKPKIGLTFAQGLRHILRQDPDVVLVGETRDLETAEIAVRASLTGHLVFSTLHTNDAPSAVIRLADMGIPPYLLAAATKAALSQRLVRTLCPECREPASVSTEDLASLGDWARRLAGKPTMGAKGCSKCLGGFRGRTGIYELLVIDEEMRDVLRAGVNLHDMRQMARARGMHTLMEDGIGKVLEGQTTVGEMLRAVGSAEADAEPA